MKITNELKTGVVVIAGLATAVLFWVKTTDFTGKPYKLKTYFGYAEGVKVDSIVKLSGIEVGRVEKIKFEYEPVTRVELILTLNRKAKIKEGSIAYISTAGLIGDAYIGIAPGGVADKPFLKEGDVIASEDPVEARKLMKKMDAIADGLDLTLAEVKKLGENLNSVVKDNRTRIDNIAVNLETTAVNFKDFSDDIKKHPWKLLMKGK